MGNSSAFGKNNRTLFIVLASVAGMLILCGGGCGLFGLIESSRQPAREVVSTKKMPEMAEEKVEQKQKPVVATEPQSVSEADEVKRKFVAANELWEADKKKEAVEIYRAINEDNKAIDCLSPPDKLRVHFRIREYEQEQTTAKPKPPLPAGRILGTRVYTVGEKVGEIPIYNRALKDVYAAATENGLTLQITADPKPLQGTNGQSVVVIRPLMVRLFDKDGNYLTHFVTSENYTLSETWCNEMNRAYDMMRANLDQIKMANPAADPGTPESNKVYRAVLLTEKAQIFVYGVKPDLLKRAKFVEIGFTKR